MPPLWTPAAKPLPYARGSLYDRILDGYAIDPWFADLQNTKTLIKSNDGFWLRQGLICVPHVDTLRSDITHEHHAPPLAGHVGIAKCHQCQVNKPTNQKPAGLLQPLPIPTHNWSSISTDLITALPRTSGGFDAWCGSVVQAAMLFPNSIPVHSRPVGRPHLNVDGHRMGSLGHTLQMTFHETGRA